MTSLTAHQVQQLVSLRLALEDALVRARGASKYRRGPAIVALDATVERASMIVAITRGITVSTNAKLDDIVSRLAENFGNDWRPTVLPDIRHLRRARNASQHEGLEPDREQVPLWATATESYVTSIIMAQFNVGIHQVVLSDAVRNYDLRMKLRLGEEAKNAGDYRTSVHHSAEAYQEALERWKSLRSDSSHRLAPSWGDIMDRNSHDYLNSRLDDIQSVLDTLAFSSDAAEAKWFASTITEQGDVMNAEDAERALAFSFEWIVEYERAAESWTPNRWHRTAVAARMVRSEEGPAYIESCISVDFQYDRIQAKFRIGDVPDEKRFRPWSRLVQEILPPRRRGLVWTVFDDGTVTVAKELAGAADFSAEVEVLDKALKRTDAVIKEALVHDAAKVRAQEQRRTDFAESIAAIHEYVPSWVTEVTWSNGIHGDDQEQIRLRVEGSVSSLKFGGDSPNSSPHDRSQLRDLILEHDSVTQCHSSGQRNQLTIIPALDPQELLRILKAADEIVCKQLEIDHRQHDEIESLVVSARKSIATILAGL